MLTSLILAAHPYQCRRLVVATWRALAQKKTHATTSSENTAIRLCYIAARKNVVHYMHNETKECVLLVRFRTHIANIIIPVVNANVCTRRI